LELKNYEQVIINKFKMQLKDTNKILIFIFLNKFYKIKLIKDIDLI